MSTRFLTPEEARAYRAELERQAATSRAMLSAVGNIMAHIAQADGLLCARLRRFAVGGGFGGTSLVAFDWRATDDDRITERAHRKAALEGLAGLVGGQVAPMWPDGAEAWRKAVMAHGIGPKTQQVVNLAIPFVDASGEVLASSGWTYAKGERWTLPAVGLVGVPLAMSPHSWGAPGVLWVRTEAEEVVRAALGPMATSAGAARAEAKRVAIMLGGIRPGESFYDPPVSVLPWQAASVLGTGRWCRVNGLGWSYDRTAP